MQLAINLGLGNGAKPYFRIANINETASELVADARAHGAILQRKGKRLLIATTLMTGFQRVTLPAAANEDPPEAA